MDRGLIRIQTLMEWLPSLMLVVDNQLDMNVKSDGQTLLVGEGDFSFSVAMTTILPAECHSNILASSFETNETIKKHATAGANIAELQKKGVNVRLSTDATHLHTDPFFRGREYSRIIFNFPHSGGKSNLKRNKQLLNDFFASASNILERRGHIMVTLCKGQGGTPADRPMRKWHDSWQVVSMAANSGFILVKTVPFNAKEYSAYTSTGFKGIDKWFHTENAVTHVFEKADCVPVPLTVEDVLISVNRHTFKCPSYVYHKLKHIRFIHNQPHHLIHICYKHISKQLKELIDSGKLPGHTLSDQGYLKCLLGQQPHILDDGRACDDDTAHHLLICDDFKDDAETFNDVLEMDINEEINGHHRNVCLSRCLIGRLENVSDMLENRCVIAFGTVFNRVQLSNTYITPAFNLVIIWPLSHDLISKSCDPTDKSHGSTEVTVEDLVHFGKSVVSVILEMLGTFLCLEDKEISLNFIQEYQIGNKYKQSIGKVYIIGDILCKNLYKEEADSLGKVCLVEVLDSPSCSWKLEIELGLSKLICLKYKISSEKFLWSTDYRVMEEFKRISYLDHELFGEAQTQSINESNEETYAGNHFETQVYKTITDPEAGISRETICLDNGCRISCKESKYGNSVRVFDDNLQGIGKEMGKLDLNSKGKRTHNLDLKCDSKKHFVAPSVYPMTFSHDMSFWENESVPFDEKLFHDVIRSVSGDEVTSVKLIDVFTEPVSGKRSQCYKITFMSVDKCLSYDCSWKLQSLIRLEVEKYLKITLR